ncbi:hypothetical protein Tco_0774437 [Tanacetum coccineum]|uniref:Uncharacterized protein n=1 Tax=Tanacetum coccineum TaxID=301880 RepID=A0ABQ4ZR16_9ASTR
MKDSHCSFDRIPELLLYIPLLEKVHQIACKYSAISWMAVFASAAVFDVRASEQYVLRNIVFRSSQVVIEPIGLFLGHRLAAPKVGYNVSNGSGYAVSSYRPEQYFSILQLHTHQYPEDDSDSVHRVDGPPIMPEDLYAYIMAAYGEVVQRKDQDDYPDDRVMWLMREEEEEAPSSANFVPLYTFSFTSSEEGRFCCSHHSSEVGESSAAGAARQDRPTISRDDPYSIAREDLYGFVDMVDVPPYVVDVRELDYDITGYMGYLVGASMRLLPDHRRGVNQRVTILLTIIERRDSKHSADHRRQRVISELLTSDHKRQVQLTKTLRLLKGLQTQMVEFQRQHGPAEGPSQPDAPGEAGSSS